MKEKLEFFVDQSDQLPKIEPVRRESEATQFKPVTVESTRKQVNI